jgi:glucose-1-phosphate thymidylyltransferase
MIVAGDNYYSFTLKKAIDHFNKYRVPTIAVHDVKSVEEAKKFGVVALNGDQVVNFEEKPQNPKSTLISTGIYLFPKESLKKFGEYIKSGNNPDAPGYFLQWLIKNETIHGVVYTDDWFDIGNVETYKKVFDANIKK